MTRTVLQVPLPGNLVKSGWLHPLVVSLGFMKKRGHISL